MSRGGASRGVPWRIVRFILGGPNRPAGAATAPAPTAPRDDTGGEPGADGRATPLRAARFVLVLLLAWGFGLRLWLAVPGLDKDRFWDEQYGVENLWSLLVEGRLRPANGFHPGLSYLPQAALLGASELLHRATRRPLFAVFDSGEDLTAGGYFLCRLLQVLLGTASLYLLYRIGRRLGSPRLGIAAALLLAVVPWHLRQSVVFKPDILLIATALGAFLAALAAAERPTLGRLAWAGAAVGLALAGKFNAGPIAIPLAVAALAEGGWRERRRWLALAVAGLAALAVCLLLTPFLVLEPGLYIHSFSRTLRDYSVKGAMHRSSHLGVLAQGLAALLSDDFHGPLIGAAGLAGLAAAPALARRRPPPRSRARRLGPLMASSYVAGYALFYASSTTNPSDHNWLPVTPFVALAAAAVLLGGWDWAASRLRRWQRLALGGAGLAAAAIFLVQPANAYVYETCVPSTQELARDFLSQRLQPLGGRVVVREEDEEARWYADPAIVLEAERLDQLPAETLDRADAEIFHAGRLSGTGSALYHRRIDRSAVVATRFEPRPWRARGHPLVVVVHRWTSQGDPEDLTPGAEGRGGGRIAAALPPGLHPGEVASLDILLPPGTDAEALQQVLLQGRPLDHLFVGRQAGSPHFVTCRFAVPAAASRVVLVLPASTPPSRDFAIQLQRWRAPA